MAIRKQPTTASAAVVGFDACPRVVNSTVQIVTFDAYGLFGHEYYIGYPPIYGAVNGCLVACVEATATSTPATFVYGDMVTGTGGPGEGVCESTGTTGPGA